MEKIAGLQDHWCGKRRQPILHFPRPAGQASRFTHCMRICGRDRGLIGLGNLEENPESLLKLQFWELIQCHGWKEKCILVSTKPFG